VYIALKSNKYNIIVILILIILMLLGYIYYAISNNKNNMRKQDENETVTITVCNAGSLTIPLQKIASMFQNSTGIKVNLEPSGSVLAVRKVVDLHRNCDVVAVADYRLIPQFMYPNYTSWYVAFASNQLVIVTKSSNYNNISLKKLLYMMENGSVSYGFSDPNLDPCGYRAVGLIGLLSLYYNDTKILQKLVIDRIPGSYYAVNNGTLNIYIPVSFQPRKPLVVRSKSIDLISLLENRQLDLAIEYKSVAVQHGLNYISLPPQVNLGDPKYDQYYSRVVVHILVGTKNEKSIPMASIVYGVTVPASAQHEKEGIEFVEFLLEHGSQVFSSLGQPFLKKPIAYGNLPEELKGLNLVEEGQG